MVGNWHRWLRIVLVLFVVGVSAAVFTGLRDRAAPARAIVVERTDPEAVIQTRGSQIVQADPLGDNVEIVSGSQSTYADGGMRLFDGVQVTVSDRADRVGFVLTGQEATVDAGQTHVLFANGVELESSDGLSATTAEARYTDEDGLVQMPGPADFVFDRNGMEAFGESAEYDRNIDVLKLFGASQVDLSNEDGRTRIRSRGATLTNTSGLMQFNDSVTIDSGTRYMSAREVRALMRDESTQLESLDLQGAARISRSDPQPGALQDMTADTIRLEYASVGVGLERATLTGQTTLDMVGPEGAAGTTIGSQTMDIVFEPGGEGLNAVVAREEVRLALPQLIGDPTRSVTAALLTISSSAGAALDFAEFEGGVVFREVEQTVDGNDVVRVTRAERLEATLSEGLASLDRARFLGDVVLETGDIVAYADEAIYTLATGDVDLVRARQDGRVPRLQDRRRGSIQARRVTLGVRSGRILATGDVESVLVPQDDENEETPESSVTAEGESGELQRPGVLEPNEPVYVTAGELDYDDEATATTYSGNARLWQTNTVFDGTQIALDDVSGNISARGSVRTEFLVNQVKDETGLQEESRTTGHAQQFDYDNGQHLATYVSIARLNGPRGDLTGDVIRVFLEADGRTLERLEADGNVELIMPTRLVSGDSLVYYDADGRYEMNGAPVQIIEQQEQGEDCRETTGRSLIFFLTEDAVSVDGQSEVRTQAARVSCPPFRR